MHHSTRGLGSAWEVENLLETRKSMRRRVIKEMPASFPERDPHPN